MPACYGTGRGSRSRPANSCPGILSISGSETSCPADAILGTGKYLLVDESALTGESLPVEKKPGDTVYSGSIARQGEMDARVTTIGGNTYFGKTARLVQNKPPRSHFQAAVERIGNYLIILAVVLVSIVLIVALLRSASFLDTLQFALILVVAAIPAALPAVMTVTLAAGAVALAKKEAIVSRLTAIEEMAGMDILCSDKTGTITQNSISIGEVRTFPGVSEQDVVIAAAQASRKESNDPIDMAIFLRYESLTARPDTAGPETLDFVPFDPVAKFSKATVQDPSGKTFEVAKGAPQAIASLAGNDGALASTLEAWVTGFAEKGFRALGVAKTDDSGKWHYLGLIGLFDPPREDSAATIAEAKKLGVNVKMVTGDHIAIAQRSPGRLDLARTSFPSQHLLPVGGRRPVTSWRLPTGLRRYFRRTSSRS